jgi:hypothetical protein
MGHQLSYNGCESLDCGEIGNPDAGSKQLSRRAWRSVLDLLVGAPVRLHHYRHLHAEVIEDALRAFDCGPERGGRT